MNGMTATYSPEDNKLRLYSVSRLPKDLYERVKAAGFSWAPKQELFVAPMWTPSREDLLLELCGEIGDEDTSLVDRAEQRSERFEEYSEHRAADANHARQAVSAIADNIPFGQPILVGHHSERHARKDAERIENGMRKAVRMWETSQYWQYRAQGAIRAAKYKELPGVRARRIKGLEADQRKEQREKDRAQALFDLWTDPKLTQEQAAFLTAHTQAGHLRLPRKDGDTAPEGMTLDAYDVFNPREITGQWWQPRTLPEVVEHARKVYTLTMAHCDRWLSHIAHRLEYERAMLEEQGASHLLKPKPRPAQLPLCNYRQAVIRIENMYRSGEFVDHPQVEMTAAEYAAINRDYKGTREVEHSHRVRVAMRQHALVSVFLTDSKVHEKPSAQAAPAPKQKVFKSEALPPLPKPERTEFDDMKESLRAGVQVVSAPQLFPTPADLAGYMVAAADLQAGQTVLEPSAGTGRLIDAAALSEWQWQGSLVAVEKSASLSSALRAKYKPECVDVRNADFLACNGDLGKFDRIIMNPPFEHGADIKHIRHAITMLKPGGRLVALCANGPKQQEHLKPLADEWIDLEPGTFKESGTMVNVAMLVITKGEP